jgi:hypothetical protein
MQTYARCDAPFLSGRSELIAVTPPMRQEARQGKLNMLACTSVKSRDAPMTYQERYEKTNVWLARSITKDLMLMKGKNEIVSEHDEQTIRDAERGDAAMRQIVKPQARL